MNQQQPLFRLPRPTDLTFPKTYSNGYAPTLNKVEAFNHHIYCGYSNGFLLHYQYSSPNHELQFMGKFHPYQNTDIIDIDQFDSDVLLTCTHNEVTLFNLVKSKSIPLKGHESTPFAVSAHPVCPYVISVSNAIVEHDVRMRKPINVNFITPPVYDVEFFQDGKQFVLSGEPCRIGRSNWIRSLLNGLAKPSINSKHILTNDMNGSISLWDWRQSEQILTINNVKNEETFQPIHFGMKEGNITDILFLQDNGKVLRYDFGEERQERRRSEFDVVETGPLSNWKMTTRTVEGSTCSLILYEHSRAVIKVFDFI